MKSRFATLVLVFVFLSLLTVLILPSAFPPNHALAAKLFANPCGGTLNTWQATTLTNAPSGRSYASAVWTGTEMLIWGGSEASGFSPYSSAGARYNPATDTWAPMSSTNQPHLRIDHTAVWTGTEMLIWGGYYNDGSWHFLNDGGRYNPITDAWTPISTTNAPLSRAQHIAVWTGEEMIVWGGATTDGTVLNTGGRYNPATDTWAPTLTTNAPSARFFHTGVWDGNEMIVWGGRDNSTTTNFDTGGKYNPWTNTWTPTSTVNAPHARHSLKSVWTGSEMIIWGGRGPSANSWDEHFVIGGRYNPLSDSWQLTTDVNAPTGRATGYSLVWSGEEMIVWGGEASGFTNEGGRYNPSTNTWTATPLTNAPSARQMHVAIWADTEMIVWGGDNGSLNTGGRLFICPSNPSPTPRPTNTRGPTEPVTPTATRTPTQSPTPGPSPTPRGDAPVIKSFAINGGALTSTTMDVNLLLSYFDPNNDLESISISNDNITWTDWDNAVGNIGWTLPSGDGIKTVYVRARDQAGHLSEIASDTITLDTTVESEYTVSINQGALYTNQVGVTLMIGAKGGTSRMQVSNDGGFVGAVWEPYASSRIWAVTAYDGSVIPRTVYLRFKDTGGNVSSTASDDIILDVKAPTGSVNIAGGTLSESSSAVTLSLSASDDLSGVGGMRLSNRSDFQNASWIPFASSKSWEFATNQVVFAQFRDNAGNVSKTYATTTCNVKPTAPKARKPKNGKSVNTTQVKLDWNDSECGTTFSVLVKEDSPTGKKAGKLKAASVSEFTTKTLARGKTYYWRAKACNVNGCVLGTWWNFKIPN